MAKRPEWIIFAAKTIRHEKQELDVSNNESVHFLSYILPE